MVGDIIAVVLLLIVVFVAFLTLKARLNAKKHPNGEDDPDHPVSCGGCPYASRCNHRDTQTKACDDTKKGS